MKMMICAQVLKRSACDAPNVKFLRDIKKKIRIRGRGREAPDLTLGICQFHQNYLQTVSQVKMEVTIPGIPQ